VGHNVGDELREENRTPSEFRNCIVVYSETFTEVDVRARRAKLRRKHIPDSTRTAGREKWYRGKGEECDELRKRRSELAASTFVMGTKSPKGCRVSEETGRSYRGAG